MEDSLTNDIVTVSTHYSLRRGVTGAFAGLVGSAALIHIVANTPLSVMCGVMAGTCYSLGFFNRSESLAETVITGSALGIPLWMLLSIIVSPGIAGQPPQWTPHSMQQKLPELVGWMFYGAGLGIAIQLLNRVLPWQMGTEPPSTPQVVDIVKTHIVIVGGGFAGMHTAATLEELFGADRSVRHHFSQRHGIVGLHADVVGGSGWQPGAYPHQHSLADGAPPYGNSSQPCQRDPAWRKSHFSRTEGNRF